MPKTDRNSGAASRRGGDAGKASRAKASPARTERNVRESRAGKAAERPSEKRARSPRRPITQEERHRMIAEAAYYKAQQRGFEGNLSDKDWLEAEAEVDARLLRDSGEGPAGDGEGD